MAIKQLKAREKMSLFIKKQEKSDNGNDTDLDQAKNKYQLKL